MSQDKHTKNRGKPKGPHDDLTDVAKKCKLFFEDSKKQSYEQKYKRSPTKFRRHEDYKPLTMSVNTFSRYYKQFLQNPERPLVRNKPKNPRKKNQRSVAIDNKLIPVLRNEIKALLDKGKLWDDLWQHQNIKQRALTIHKNLNFKHNFEASSTWCNNLKKKFLEEDDFIKYKGIEYKRVDSGATLFPITSTSINNLDETKKKSNESLTHHAYAVNASSKKHAPLEQKPDNNNDNCNGKKDDESDESSYHCAYTSLEEHDKSRIINDEKDSVMVCNNDNDIHTTDEQAVADNDKSNGKKDDESGEKNSEMECNNDNDIHTTNNIDDVETVTDDDDLIEAIIDEDSIIDTELKAFDDLHNIQLQKFSNNDTTAATSATKSDITKEDNIITGLLKDKTLISGPITTKSVSTQPIMKGPCAKECSSSESTTTLPSINNKENHDLTFDTGRHSTGQPISIQPTTKQPSTGQHSTGQHSSGQPSSAKSITTTEEPSTGQPTTGQATISTTNDSCDSMRTDTQTIGTSLTAMKPSGVKRPNNGTSETNNDIMVAVAALLEFDKKKMGQNKSQDKNQIQKQLQLKRHAVNCLD